MRGHTPRVQSTEQQPHFYSSTCVCVHVGVCACVSGRWQRALVILAVMNLETVMWKLNSTHIQTLCTFHYAENNDISCVYLKKSPLCIMPIKDDRND